MGARCGQPPLCRFLHSEEQLRDGFFLRRAAWECRNFRPIAAFLCFVNNDF